MKAAKLKSLHFIIEWISGRVEFGRRPTETHERLEQIVCWKSRYLLQQAL